MALYEKLSIYVPLDTKMRLEEDAKLFEVYKSNSKNINLNRFLSSLILGYYDNFYSEVNDMTARISTILKNHISSVKVDNIDTVSKEIFQTLIFDNKSGENKKEAKMSLKPTVSTDALIEDIKATSINDSISNTFVRLFRGYLNKPSYLRERIIYKENYDKLEESIRKKKTISFSTTKSPDLVHTVFPYELTTGSEELFNYLLCAEMDSSGTLRAKSYRLSRIGRFHICRSALELTDTVKNYLDKMKLYSPAFEINDSKECCVYLTEEGHNAYNLVYYQRPAVSGITKVKDGYLYYFECSKEHVMRYFRRFNPGQAFIREPKWLKKAIISSYEDMLEEYKK